MTNYKELIDNKLKEAMLARDNSVEVLRAIKTKFTELEKSVKDPSESDYITVLKKAAKQRRESHLIYVNAARAELAYQEMSEALFIEDFLPKQLDEWEVIALIKNVIYENNIPLEQSQMGNIVKLVVKESGGQTDGKTVSTLFRSLL